jgi:hypothetical protein
VRCSLLRWLQADQRDGPAPSLRYILLNMIEEYARHNGHADLIRESIDGRVGNDSPALNVAARSLVCSGKAALSRSACAESVLNQCEPLGCFHRRKDSEVISSEGFNSR